LTKSDDTVEFCDHDNHHWLIGRFGYRSSLAAREKLHATAAVA